MPLFNISDVKIEGLSAAVPSKRIKNADYKWLSESEREKLIKTTGINERRVAPEDITSSDLCKEAAQSLMGQLNWSPESIDILIFTSQTGDYIIPPTAPILQNKLYISQNCMAFDLTMGCSGYIYGLSIASSLLSQTGLNRALLLVGDVASKYTSYHDKSSYPLFGDAGSATALVKDSSHNSSMAYNLQTDGSGYDTIMIPDGGTRHPATKSSFDKNKKDEGIIRSKVDVQLKGEQLFEFTNREVAPNIEKLLEYSDQKKSDINYFILHQANRLLNETVRKTLNIHESKVPYSLHNYGNTITASIPITLITQLKNKLEKNHLNLLLSGFGVGLSWGSVNLKTNKINCLELIEI